MNDLPVHFVYITVQLHYIYKSSIPACCATELPDYKICNVLKQLYESQCLRLRVCFSELYFSSHLLRFLVRILVIARAPFHCVFQTQSRFCGCKDLFPSILQNSARDAKVLGVFEVTKARHF